MAAQQATITEQADKVSDALAGTQTAKTHAETDAAAIAEYLKNVKQLSDDATAAKSAYDETINNASILLTDAQKALQTVVVSRDDADTKINEGAKKIATATEKLDKAIADINLQSLAGSYQKSAEQMGKERTWWLVTFVVALGYISLVASGFIEKWLGVTPSTGDVYWVRLLHLIPLASPGIWLGWFAARSAGITTRIQQDYAYKVATALTYEAHKKEAAISNAALAGKLLEVTIRNFGDNPIRLYDGKGMEGHPLESLKPLFADKEHFDQVVKLLALRGNVWVTGARRL